MILAVLMTIMSAAEVMPSEPDPAAFDAFLEEFAQKRGGIKVLEAAFRQENETAEGTRTLMGILKYAYPRRIMFKYHEPEVAYVIDGTRVYEYDREVEQMQTFDLDDDPTAAALFLGFDEEPERLRNAYAIDVFDPIDVDGAAKALELRPKDRKPASGEEKDGHDEAADANPAQGLDFESMRLYLREGDYLPCRIVVDNGGDSTVTLTITDFKVSAEENPDAVSLTIPEGTTVVENEEIVETVGPGGKRIPADSAAPAAPATDTPPQ